MRDVDIIVTAEYGSRAVGVATEFSDHDYMSVFIEQPGQITGIDRIDTQKERTADEGQRSTKDDSDTTLYPLQKWASLAAGGNPSILSLLFIKPLKLDTGYWEDIVSERDLFISKEAGRKFRGYSYGQRQALTGMRNKKTNRPELVHTHGYDTKFAYHMIRTAMQGIELMETGVLVLPMHDNELNILKAIRAGEISKEDCLDLEARLNSKLEYAIEHSELPDQPDRNGINRLLHDIYLTKWSMLL